jgi:sugar O-acyltransferase (sialic acid O-acetyltransferase NeuD family)
MLYALYGAGGFAREVMPLLAAQYSTDPIAFVVDSDILADHYETVNGVMRMTFKQFLDYGGSNCYCIAIADSKAREQLADKCDMYGAQPFSIFAKTSIIGPGVSIDPGAILCDQSMVTCNAAIGKHFQANIYSYVAHDCVIGDYVTLAPRASINGNCKLGDHVYVGTGAVLKQGLTVGDGAVIGMGAVVTKDVPPHVTVVGNPARVMQPK